MKKVWVLDWHPSFGWVIVDSWQPCPPDCGWRHKHLRWGE